MGDVIRFNFRFEQQATPIRVVLINGDPWFVTVDVCRTLEIQNTRQAVKDFPADEMGVCSTYTHNRRGAQWVTILDERGLFRLVGNSRKPQARPFQDWIYREVLPSIRRTGKYEIAPKPDAMPELLKKINQQEKLLTDIIDKLGDERLNFSDKSIKWAAEAVAQDFKCECIFCREVLVVTIYGRRLPEASRIHHGNFNRQDSSKENCTLPCIKCHERLHDAKHPQHIPQHKAIAIAIAFSETAQKRRRQIKSSVTTDKNVYWDFTAAEQTDFGFPVRKRQTGT